MKKNGTKPEKQRSRVSQEDVPAYSLAEATRVARALHENFGKQPGTALRLAGAMGLSPTSSVFKMLTGASIAYGLTEGGYNAANITLLPLGQRIVRPTEEGDDLTAKRQAFLRPRVIGEFLKRYDNSPVPKDEIGQHVLEDLGVPRERTASVFSIIATEAKELGLLHEIKGKFYVDLQGTCAPAPEGDKDGNPEKDGTEQRIQPLPNISFGNNGSSSVSLSLPPNRKVFITHGKNRAFVEPIKKFLEFGEMEPFVSVEKQTVSEPVPDKVMNEMRACAAAIIHVEDELKLMDTEGREHIMLNPNVLIEIGAAMALYGRRFILLVKEGVRLPSNLQGLFEVRYKGDSLDSEATVKLLGAIAELKKIPEPARARL
jgi:predicted nucleotide-binding protein